MLKHRHFATYVRAFLLVVCAATIARAQNLHSLPTFIGQPNQPQNNSPITIDRPGNYVLARDVVVQGGDAITIAASGVTLDLNGRTVSTGASGAGRGICYNPAPNANAETDGPRGDLIYNNLIARFGHEEKLESSNKNPSSFSSFLRGLYHSCMFRFSSQSA